MPKQLSIGFSEDTTSTFLNININITSNTTLTYNHLLNDRHFSYVWLWC